jgi:nicotinate-nucleotide--dimethylbenzimidazole phosphoribosyltransferase
MYFLKDVSDPLDVLSKIGGTEIGGIAGVVLGAAVSRIPVVIDGFISTAGALIAYAIEPKTRDYMFSAHQSQELGHKAMLQKLGLSEIGRGNGGCTGNNDYRGRT